MKSDTYYTILSPSEGLYREKGSKFIALTYPLITEQEVKGIVDRLRKEHPGACHFCYAYRIGADGNVFRANDDGEPSGSAGKPILNQLLSFELSDLLVVVVRYFGGTKLGVSGLINAYKEAAKSALAIAQVGEKIISNEIQISFSYSYQGEVEKLIKEFESVIVEKSFDDRGAFRVQVPKSRTMGFLEKISTLSHLDVQVEKTTK